MFAFDPGVTIMVISLGLAALFVGEAMTRLQWRQATLQDLHVWAVATAVVFVGHQMSANLPAGIELHYLAGAALALVLGYPRAIVTMAIVLTLDSLLQAELRTLGLRILCAGVLPVTMMTVIASLARQHLPRNPFVFLLGCGFFGLFAVYATQQVVTMLVRGAIDPIAPVMREDYLAFALLLAGGEATLEGMIITIMVVFMPGTVRLFDDSYYLRNG